MSKLPPLLFVALIACTKDTPSTATGGERVELETRDGVTLVADLYAGAEGASSVVLLHMVPPTYDRSSWPAVFIEALKAEGWWVLALDRRGAGDSEGEATEAYTGENGRYDVEAAALLLQDRGAGALGVVGASNGTTSALDYTAWSRTEGAPEPVVVGMMTGGTYTVNNTSMDELPPTPTVFTYSTVEAEWSAGQMGLDPGTWSFLEYPDGAHGTDMFDAAPEVTGDLTAYLGEHLP